MTEGSARISSARARAIAWFIRSFSIGAFPPTSCFDAIALTGRLRAPIGNDSRAYLPEPARVNIDRLNSRCSSSRFTRYGLRASASLAASVGYDGKWVVHPSQIDIVNAAFSPTREAFDEAVAILEALDRASRRDRLGAVRMRADAGRGEPPDGRTRRRARTSGRPRLS